MPSSFISKISNFEPITIKNLKTLNSFLGEIYQTCMKNTFRLINRLTLI